MELVKQLVRDVPDFPKPGIVFKDITPVLNDPKAMATVIDVLAEQYVDRQIDRIVAIESRGFIFGAPLAHRLGIGLVLVRKPGKLPAKTRAMTYELEYGTDTIEMHDDELEAGQRVVIIDDLLATGGTAKAAADLCRTFDAEVVSHGFVIELGFLEGRNKLDGEVFSLIEY